MRRIVGLAALISLTMTLPFLRAEARPDPQIETASRILESMTPEERVGQLFLVTFEGSAIDDDDPITSLIRDYHVSGVLLRAVNSNFTNAPETLTDVHNLIHQLQEAERLGRPSDESTAQETDAQEEPVYMPLLIGIQEGGTGSPESQILRGLTPLPSQMALGATWDSELAREVGAVLGSELESLGVNLLIGPSLDVLEDPRRAELSDLGVEAFGGEPFWVSKMGAAFVAGLHQGSSGRLAVVAKHFPGQGSSDRPLEEEVATIRKSLEELKQIELAPFFAVADSPPGEKPETVDALLSSHIRYQGLQGNIRATTRPISLDREAFELLMSLDPLPAWREGGGVMISDSLGSRAIRRFHDPAGLSFRAHLVARDAFLAGNDLLLLTDFQSPEDADEFETITNALAFFAQKYREDPVFAGRVDESVLRILRLKLRLYQNRLAPEVILPPTDELDSIGTETELSFRVAQRAATLISPDPEVLAERLGGAPQFGERIVFFTDVRMARQCLDCDPVPGIDQQALEDAVQSLYGTQAAGQVGEWNLSSFTMADLASFLGDPVPGGLGYPILPGEELEEPLRSANWLVFSILDSSDGAYGSDALKLLLERRPDLAREKRIVVFAHDVPFELDATEVSTLDVYYALYSKASPFVDVAARLLFGELSAPGASPVSVPGAGYDLSEATAPDPSQVLTLRVRSAIEGEISPEPGGGFSVGETVFLETGTILDRNRHTVPDNTPVDFILTYQGEGAPAPIRTTAFTVQGAAQTELALDRIGLLRIQAESGSARTSEIIQLNVQEGQEAFVTVIAPTPELTETVSPPSTPTLPAPTPDGVAEVVEPPVPTEITGPGAMYLLVGLIGVVAVSGGGYWNSRARGDSSAASARQLWITIVASLAGYNYAALGLPGADALAGSIGVLAGFLGAVLAGLLAILGIQFWQRMGDRD